MTPSASFYVAIAGYIPYVTLCAVAIWSTFQGSSPSHKWMRRALVVMLGVLTVAFVFNAVQFSVKSNPVFEILQVALNVATCLAGVLSDGLLAWRCFVLFGKRSWMKWALILLVATDFEIGALSNISLGTQLRLDEYSEVPQGGQKLIDYYNAWDRAERNSGLAQKLILAWAWIFFALNTTMTMSMIYKIVSSGIRVGAPIGLPKERLIYNTAIRAIIESSLISWIGLLAYAIARTFSFASSHFTATSSAVSPSSLAFTILPFMLGSSQSLIIARVGFSRLQSPSSAAKCTALVFASDHQTVEEEESSSSVLDKGRDDIIM